MKILVNRQGYVDLEAPIWMTEKNKKKFIDFFKDLFDKEMVVEEVEEKAKEMGEREVTIKKWVVEDYSLLLGPKTNSELANEMERTEMSVKMQRGHFVPEFLVWLKKKGYAFTKDKKIIKEFLEETGK